MTDLSQLTPRQLAREFELDRITREQFQEAMLSMQVELLTEAQESRLHPVTAYLNERLNKRALRKILKSASEAELREILHALGDVENFPPARLLWNADQRDIPLFVFVRVRQEPVFRITYLNVTTMRAEISVEYGSARKAKCRREDFVLTRTAGGYLRVEERRRRN